MTHTQTIALAAPDWEIPLYAQDKLWIAGNQGSVRAQGAQGRFAPDESSTRLTLRWDGAEGVVLAQFPRRPETLGWKGTIAAGGYIDALHVTELPGLDTPVMVIFLDGQPLQHNLSPWPAAAARAPYTAPDFFDGLIADFPEQITTWLVSAESALAALAHDVLTNNLRLYCFGQLAAEAGGWHKHFALPILLDSATLFAP